MTPSPSFGKLLELGNGWTLPRAVRPMGARADLPRPIERLFRASNGRGRAPR